MSAAGRNGWSRTRGRSAATRRTCRRRSAPAGNGSGNRPAASWPTPRTRIWTVAVFSWSGRVYAVDLTRPDAVPARGAGARPGAGSAARPDREAAGLRLRRGAAGGQPGRPRRRPGPGGPAGRPAPDVRAGGVHRGRGDGPPPRLLVVPGRLGAAGRAGGRDARQPVAHRRPGQPGAAARRGGLSGRRHPERRGVPPAGQAGRHHRGRRDRPRRVPLPGDRLLGGRARPAGGGAEPGPADDAAADRRRRHRPGRGAARGHRPALAGDRPRRPGLDRGRPAGVDRRPRGHPPPAGQPARGARRRPSRSPRPACRCAASSASTATPCCSRRPPNRPRSSCGPTGPAG